MAAPARPERIPRLPAGEEAGARMSFFDHLVELADPPDQFSGGHRRRNGARAGCLKESDQFYLAAHDGGAALRASRRPHDLHQPGGLYQRIYQSRVVYRDRAGHALRALSNMALRGPGPLQARAPRRFRIHCFFHGALCLRDRLRLFRDASAGAEFSGGFRHGRPCEAADQLQRIFPVFCWSCCWGWASSSRCPC